MRPSVLALLLSLFLAGCEEEVVPFSVVDTAVEDTGPDILQGDPIARFSTDWLLFPNRTDSNTPLVVTNDGDGDLVIRHLSISPEESGFYVGVSSWTGSDVIIPPGRSFEFAFYFDGSDRDATARLEFWHNGSSDSGSTEIPMEVAAGVSQLVIAPNPIDFGSVRVGESKTMNVTIHNDGQNHLIISEVGTSDTSGSVTIETIEVPARVSSARHQVLEVTVSPQTVDDATAWVFVESDALEPRVSARIQVEIDPL